MSPTSIVAWWGAILSTIVFLWDIYKHRTAGPRLRFTIQSGMKSINIPLYEGKTLIHVDVTNLGDRPTTITNVCFLYFKGRRFLRKRIPDRAAIVLDLNRDQPIPFELKPGALWSGVAIQNKEVEEWATTGILDMTLHHSHSSKALRQRVIIRKK
jgi:hypothetical protein